MFGDRFSSSTSCSRWVHETEPDRPDQSLTCCFLKVATHPVRAYVLWGPLASLLSLLGLVRSVFKRDIEWRGIRYRMLSPEKTLVLE